MLETEGGTARRGGRAGPGAPAPAAERRARPLRAGVRPALRGPAGGVGAALRRGARRRSAEPRVPILRHGVRAARRPREGAVVPRARRPELAIGARATRRTCCSGRTSRTPRVACCGPSPDGPGWRHPIAKSGSDADRERQAQELAERAMGERDPENRYAMAHWLAYCGYRAWLCASCAVRSRTTTCARSRPWTGPGVRLDPTGSRVRRDPRGGAAPAEGVHRAAQRGETRRDRPDRLPLPRPVEAGRRRHGRRLRGRGPEARPPRRAEVPAGRARRRRPGARAPPPRGARGLLAPASAHLHDLRRRRGPRASPSSPWSCSRARRCGTASGRGR